MSGSPGDGEGEVHLAHAWTARENRKTTVGDWHWWNVYKDHQTAVSQAARAAERWPGVGKYEVHTIQGGTD